MLLLFLKTSPGRPLLRMHPSEVWPCCHRRRGDEGGGSDTQEVNNVILRALCLISLPSLLPLCFSPSSSSVFCSAAELFSVLLSLAHRLAERGLALAGSEGGVSISPNNAVGITWQWSRDNPAISETASFQQVHLYRIKWVLCVFNTNKAWNILTNSLWN